MWRSYTRAVPNLMKAQHNAQHPKRRKSAAKAARQLKTIAGRLVQELERKLDALGKATWEEKLGIFNQILGQASKNKNKIYAIHAPEVACIAKGKVHPKFEFGSKVSIAMTRTECIIVSAVNFAGNPYDGNTVEPTLEQYERLFDTRPKCFVADRGYRGKKQHGATTVLIPSVPKPTDTAYAKGKARKRFRRRTAIELVIGHLKNRFGLKRNWLKGTLGDQINLLLSAAAGNFKKWLNKQPNPFSWAVFAWFTAAARAVMAMLRTLFQDMGAGWRTHRARVA